MNPFSPLWSAAINLRNWCYDHRLISNHQLDIPVISVGNITMGGTGKTPFIHWLIHEINQLGYKPGVITRNYKANGNESAWVSGEYGAYRKFGDEAVLLKVKNPKIGVLSGPTKWQSAVKMHSESQETQVILVDDGFQHRKLHRDMDIVLLDVSVPPHDYEWPPIGRARESFSELSRAHVIVYSRWELRREETLSYLQQELPPNLKVPILKAEHKQGKPHWIHGKPINNENLFITGKGLAFCGLGNAQGFYSNLLSQNLNIASFIPFPDHFHYRQDDIKKIIKAAHDFDYIVTSEKDMVKLQEWPHNGPTLCVVPLEIQISGDKEAFHEQLVRLFR